MKPEQAINFWSESARQLAQVKLLVQRVASWKSFIQDTIKIISKLLHAHSQASHNFDDVLGSFKNHEALSTLRVYVQATSSEFKATAEYIKQNGVLPLQQLLKTMRKESKILTKAVSTQQSGITKKRRKIMRLMHANKQSLLDSWLNQRILLNKLNAHIKEEEYYQHQMILAKQRIKELDRNLHEKLFVIINMLTKSSGESSDAGLPFKTFEEENDLVDDPWKAVHVLQNIYDSEEYKTEKEGFMQRRSTILKTWKNVYYILTETGYLHCFPVKNGGHVHDSMLRDESIYSIDMQDPKLVIEYADGIICIKSSKSGKHFVIKAKSESEMIEWVGLLKSRQYSVEVPLPPQPLFKTQKELDEDIRRESKSLDVQRELSMREKKEMSAQHLGEYSEKKVKFKDFSGNDVVCGNDVAAQNTEDEKITSVNPVAQTL